MSTSTARFGWDNIEDAREAHGCHTCATASLCPGPCPIEAHKKLERNQPLGCDSPEATVNGFLELFKDDLLKLPFWNLS